MKTSFDIVDFLFQLIDASSLKTAVSGGVYKNRRPINSKLEDVVINCLPVNNLQLQSGLANVNIYVPNLAIKVNDAVDDKQPDNARMKALAAIAKTVLDDIWSEDINFSVSAQMVFSDDESLAHYINFRLDFYSINILN